jgi:hypothetical protein
VIVHANSSQYFAMKHVVLAEHYWHHPNPNIFWLVCSKLQS